MRLFPVLAVAVGVLAAGCQRDQKGHEPPQGGTAGQPGAAAPVGATDIDAATAGTGGVCYPIGNAIAQVWSTNVSDVKATDREQA